MPPYAGFDETAHYSYIQQLAETGHWPRHGDPVSAEVEGIEQAIPLPEALHAQLTYQLFALVGGLVRQFTISWVEISNRSEPLAKSSRPSHTLLKPSLVICDRRSDHPGGPTQHGGGMFRLSIVSVCIVLLKTMVPALAAETRVQPLALQDCKAVADAVGGAIGMTLMTKIGPAPSYPDGLRGNACLISGKATGLTLEFERAQEKIAAALAGWQHLEQFDADGPYSTVKGFAKGQQRVFYSLSTDPPAGTCRSNKPISDCKVPRGRWTWQLTTAAFSE